MAKTILAKLLSMA